MRERGRTWARKLRTELTASIGAARAVMAVAPMFAGRFTLRRGAGSQGGGSWEGWRGGRPPLGYRLSAQRHAELLGEVVAVAAQHVVALGFVFQRQAVEDLVHAARGEVGHLQMSKSAPGIYF